MSGDSGIVDFSNTALSEEDVQERVKELRKLVLEDEHLKNFRLDDAYLLRFLHCTNFDVNPALKRMHDYMVLFLQHPDWFATTPPLDKKTQLEWNSIVLLKERDKSDRNIMIVKFANIDVSNTNPPQLVQLLEIWTEMTMDDPKTQLNGINVIVDLNGYSWKMFRWITPSNLRIATRKLDLYPIKKVLIHVVNTSFLLNASVKIAWPFLTEKIKNMIKFHFGNWPSLHQYISPDVLPLEYAGTGSNIDYEKLVQELFDKNSELGTKVLRLPAKKITA